MKLDEAAAAQLPVVEAAWRFLRPLYGQADLRGAWPYVHPTLRLCWAQWWLVANRAAIERDGFELGQVAQALTEPAPQHQLWTHFDRVLTRELTTWLPVDLAVAGIGTGARPVGLDLEVLYVHAEAPEGGVWEEGVEADALPLVMQLDDGEWQVLNLGYEAVPMPGWPPKLWEGPPHP